MTERDVTYVGDVRHSLQSALGLERAGVLRRYVGPTFFTRRGLPPLGEVGRRLRGARVVDRLPQGYRPLVASEAARHFRPRSAAAVRRVEMRLLCRDTHTLVLMNGVSGLQLDDSLFPGGLICERRGLHPGSYNRLIESARTLGDTSLPGWSEGAGNPLNREISRSRGFIVYSQVAADSYAGQVDTPCRVVHLGMDPYVPGSFRPVPRDVPTVGFVGRADFAKGYDRFVELARNLRGQARFVSIGTSRPWGTALAVGQVEALGPFAKDRLTQYWGELDYLVLPARVESFGLVALEALSHGVVPLVSPETGVSEVLVDLEPGLVCADLAAMAHQILNGEARSRLSGELIDAFAGAHSWATFGDDFARAVTELRRR